MLLPLPQTWPVRCLKCGHRAEITASVVELAVKTLRCSGCGHRQPFEPATVVKSSREPNGWRAARARRGRTQPRPAMTPDLPPDRLDDLWA